MGNCIEGSPVITPLNVKPKKISQFSRKSRSNDSTVPSYPSIEDIINRNRRSPPPRTLPLPA